MKTKTFISLIVLFSFLHNFSALACNTGCGSKGENSYKMSATFEYGFSSIVGHEIQFGENNPRMSFTKEGGQSTLFPSWRSSLALVFLANHTMELTYQPIYLDTQGIADRQLQFDNVILAAQTPIDARYYFPYYRLSYFYHLIENDSFSLLLGGGLQIRNTTVSFASTQNGDRFATTNIGPVPLVTARLHYAFNNSMWIGSDLGGIWAPIPGLNGSENPVTGWLYDCAILGGLNLNPQFSWHVSARLIGGGASGDGAARLSGERYAFNSLNALNFTTGLTYNYDGNF